ncbi:hypothetical protein [Frankia sp. CiP3]|uniref:hypothetical protein n=1 Tax=Frankia sp. CiP3 TaxID=2880971 RepID=UPI001EF65F9C|nr:hypothetical protein [Frankia sp. CiP3]
MRGLGRPAPKSLRQIGSGRPGGQDGSTLRMVVEPGEAVVHEPGPCAGCEVAHSGRLVMASRGNLAITGAASHRRARPVSACCAHQGSATVAGFLTRLAGAHPATAVLRGGAAFASTLGLAILILTALRAL